MYVALGMEIPPFAAESLVDVLDQSVIEQVSAVLPPEPNEAGVMTTPQDIVEMAQKTAWTGRQLSMLAEWAELNSAPLDLSVQTANRPRYYSPSPTYLAGRDYDMLAMLLPGIRVYGRQGVALRHEPCGT